MAVTLLDGLAYTWYSIQGNVACWSDLKVVLRDYFKPANYVYKMRQALAKCRQHESVTNYIMQLSQKYT